MARIPKPWLEENHELLTLIFSNNILNGKKNLITDEKLISWINENHPLNSVEEINSRRKELIYLLQEMSHHQIITIKRMGGIQYIYPEEDYFNLKRDIILKSATIIPNIDDENPLCSNDLGTPLQYLYKKITSFSGDGKEYLRDLPKLIDLSARIMYDKRTDWTIKSMISSALGYMLIANNRKEEDYFDDLFVISFVLKHTENVAPYLLTTNWVYDVKLKTILNAAYQNSRLILTDKECRNILHVLGIPALINYYEPFEKRSSIGMIAYLMGLIYNTPNDQHKLEYIEAKLLSLGIYDDVQRILDIAHGELIPKSEMPKSDDILSDYEYDLFIKGDL
ncbi:MAG: hypothetical protein PHS04_07100 [Tissierellia bacterium]|nr:hypothetical protein [Tissierellia bacterium]